ncbi:MAG: MBOAT family O-acyltransferase [Bacilli bacterium]
MVFSSTTFLFLYLPILLFLYFICKNKTYKNIILCLFSLGFYAWGEPVYVFLMLLSITSAYFHSKYISKNLKNGNIKIAKILLISSIIISMLALLYFKYSNFIITNFNWVFHLNIPLLNLVLPIGISFYTFQIISYLVDVYKGKVDFQSNFISLTMYVSLFPQLIAGPIVRYQTIEKEINNRKVTLTLFVEGFKRFIIGLAKKVIIANQMALLADAVFGKYNPEIGTILLWIGAIAYTFQIYFDFSGYSDMAIGLGKMFGFTFLENFNYPYISKSISEFWHRWHISLSTFFRDYLYIPLGGNRVSKIKWFFNIFIVWFLTGMWHGASWNFILWGLYFGFILVIEKLFLLNIINKLPKILRWLYAMILIIVGWVLFRVTNVEIAFEYIAKMFIYYPTNFKVFCANNMASIYSTLFIILAIIGSGPAISKILNKVNKNRIENAIINIFYIVVFLLSIVFLISSTYNPFIYFRF